MFSSKCSTKRGRKEGGRKKEGRERGRRKEEGRRKGGEEGQN